MADAADATADASRPFFATAAKGTEGALRDELRDLRLPSIRATRGGVHFGGAIGHAMRACLRSRIAVRVLWRVAAFEAADADALYDGARAVDWSVWLDAARTLAVSATVKDGGLRHSGFVAQKVKDAAVDRLREDQGARPDVDRSDPDVHIVVHALRDRVSLFVDVAGASLSKRGYRGDGGAAPLKEHLAAAVLRLGGYQPGTPLIDPMCGSGTLPIEAALWSAGLPPGDGRRLGFTRWRSFDEAMRKTWAQEREYARAFAAPVASETRASDRDGSAVARATANAERAGVEVAFRTCALRRADVPPVGGMVVTNPPYGVRLHADEGWLADFRRYLGDARQSRVVVITADRMLDRELGVRADAEHTLFNGDLECRLFTWKAR